MLAPAGPPLEKRVQKYILSQKYILRLEVHFLDTQTERKFLGCHGAGGTRQFGNNIGGRHFGIHDPG